MVRPRWQKEQPPLLRLKRTGVRLGLSDGQVMTVRIHQTDR